MFSRCVWITERKKPTMNLNAGNCALAEKQKSTTQSVWRRGVRRCQWQLVPSLGLAVCHQALTPPHSREQDELFIWLTVNVPASSPHPHPGLTNDGQGSTHYCHSCPSNCPPLALHPSQSSPKPTHCLATWTAPHFYCDHHPPSTHPHVKPVNILDWCFPSSGSWKKISIGTKSTNMHCSNNRLSTKSVHDVFKNMILCFY